MNGGNHVAVSIYENIMKRAPIGYMILQCNSNDCDSSSVQIIEANDALLNELSIKIPLNSISLRDCCDHFIALQLTTLLDDSIRISKDIERRLDYKGYTYNAICQKLPDQRFVIILVKVPSHIESFLESERMKLDLLENIPGMAYRCAYDRDWTMDYVSEGCFELTGYNREELIANNAASFNDLILPEYREKIWDLWTAAVESGKAFRMEYEILAKDGATKWVYEQGQALYDKTGKVEALGGIIIDVTLQKDREKEINYLTYHDSMTGLFNRRYFGEISNRLVLENSLPISVIIGDINGLKLINDAFGHELGDCLIRETANILKASVRSTDIVTRIGGDEFAIFLPHTHSSTAEAILNRIDSSAIDFNEQNQDTPIKINISLGLATMFSRDEDLEDVIRSAEDIMYKNKLFEHKSSHKSILNSIRGMLEKRGEFKEENMTALQCIAQRIGEELGLAEDMIQNLLMLASIHDLGKVTIDSEILGKKEPLSDSEWEILRKHPEMGYRIAMASIELASIADYILCHHERWDGTGYPSGLKGESIPLLSRIISIIDAYDAMTSGRPYRKGISKEEAMKEILDNAGTQFDPNLAKLFVGLMETNEKLC